MSRQTPIKPDIDPAAVPPRAPKNRDELVVENRARGQSDPARDRADVRAGPGDAGGQRSPRIVPGAPDEAPARGRALPVLLGLFVGALLILALVAWL